MLLGREVPQGLAKGQGHQPFRLVRLVGTGLIAVATIQVQIPALSVDRDREILRRDRRVELGLAVFGLVGQAKGQQRCRIQPDLIDGR